MSSMRNAAPRRPHRERSQPTARSKWGLLEKHKDYSLRAADYNAKKKKLSILGQKARERHPDEFAFTMVHKTQNKHGQRGTENRLSVDAVKLLKTQDAGYLRTVAGRTRRELEKAEHESQLSQAMRVRDKPKIVFDQDGEPVKKRRRVSSNDREGEEQNEEQPGDEVDEPAAQTEKKETPPKSGKQLLREHDRLAKLKADRKRRKRLQELRANKLNVLRKRQQDIQAAAQQLDLQRAKMSGQVGGVNKNGVKFKVRERRK